jgi:DNA polymerase-3 subunit epsilon
MDIEIEAAVAGEMLDAVPLGEIIVLTAAPDELAAHDKLLAGLDKAVKGNCVWRAYTPADA